MHDCVDVAFVVIMDVLETASLSALDSLGLQLSFGRGVTLLVLRLGRKDCETPTG